MNYEWIKVCYLNDKKAVESALGDETKSVIDLIGIENFTKLLKMFDGEAKYSFPMTAIRRMKDDYIKLCPNTGVDKLAFELGCTTTAVYMAKRRLSNNGSD